MGTEEAIIQLEDGTQIQLWKSYSIDSDFLTPTDGWSFDFGTEVEWKKLQSVLVPDAKVQIIVGGALQLSGSIDVVEASCDEGGTVINVQGRDILKPMVKGTIYPDIPYQKKNISQLVEEVLKYIYQGSPPTVYYSNAANISLITGAGSAGASKWKVGAGVGAAANPSADFYKQEWVVQPADTSADAARKAQTQKELALIKPQQGESCFAFLERNLRRFGLWLWATADGSIVVGGPNYEQAASYIVRRRRGDPYPYVLRASWRFDRTDVPSSIIVRGVTTVAEKDKKQISGSAHTPKPIMFCPKYLKNDHGSTPEFCRNFALQELSKARQNEEVYSCTVVGHRNPVSGAVYAVDTVCRVEDEFLGISDDYYVKRRTFKKSVMAGTTTDLELVPLYSIQFSDVDAKTPTKKKKW